MEAGLRRRADEVSALLRADRTQFVVVTSPRSEAIDEARFLLDGLRDGSFPLGGVVVNLVHPRPPTIDAIDGDLDPDVLGDGPFSDQLIHHRDLTRLADDERAELEPFVADAAPAAVRELPLLDEDVHDLVGLAVLAELLVGP